jgi:cell division protease FtsH
VLPPAVARTKAVHEAGHAVCALSCPQSTPLERISLAGNAVGRLGLFDGDSGTLYGITRRQLLDDLCVLMGGREAEQLLLGDLSLGIGDDLQRAARIARRLVEDFAPGLEPVAHRGGQSSQAELERVERQSGELLEAARQRAAAILHEHRPWVETVRDLLLALNSLDLHTLDALLDPRAE